MLENILYTSLVLIFPLFIAIKEIKFESMPLWAAVLMLAGFFGCAAAGIVTALMLIWA